MTHLLYYDHVLRMVSLRLDKKTEQALKRVAKSKGITQSEYLRSIIDKGLKAEVEKQTPWSLGQEIIGKYGSGRGDLAGNRKSLLKEKLRAKQSSH
ncbi:MAG: CopG family transcriptional regulator [Flavobacteriaceae bacterium]